MNAIALAEMKALLKRRGYTGWSVRQQHGVDEPIVVSDDSDAIRWFIFGHRNGQWNACDGIPGGIIAHGDTAAASLDTALDTALDAINDNAS